LDRDPFSTHLAYPAHLTHPALRARVLTSARAQLTNRSHTFRVAVPRANT